MNNVEFEKVVSSRIAEIHRIFIEKGAQYARGDRLSNFKKAGRFRYKEPEEILMGLVIKHFTALDDYVQDLPNRVMSEEQWKEKIGDIINYMILLESLIEERFL